MAGLLERVAAARPAPGWYSWRINEASPSTKALTPSQVPERRGYSYGIPRGGLTEYNSGIGEATQTDRRSQLQQLYEAYLACPWSWACVNAIARTITAGGMVMDWDTDTGEGNQEAPDKPEPVLAVERLFKFCNPRQNIRQLMRNVVVDLEVFADAFIEVTWWGNTPVALYNLDNPTTTPIADEHGNVTGYVQVTEFGQRAEFEERDVIHISLDAPRSGVFGVSPTQAALLPITAWLFAAACGKEMARKGLPPSIHVDFPASVQIAEQNRWAAQYQARNVGPRNIGTPVVTKGGAHIAELASGKIADVLAFLDQKRDEIIAGYGVPPSKVSIIESGNLGGGTGEEQTRTYEVDTCGPIGELVLEAFNFAIVQNGFGVDDWQAKFRDVDYRASSVIEGIRDQRLRNGSYCVDVDTEILTSAGWKTHSDLRPGDTVLTLNSGTGCSEWQECQEVHMFPAAPRDMIRMRSRAHSSVTTANHRWPVEQYTAGSKVKEYRRRWVTSETMTYWDRIQTAARNVTLPVEAVYDDAFVELVAWFWTEGHAPADSAPVFIAQKKPDGVDRIRRALEKLFGPPYERSRYHRKADEGAWIERVDSDGMRSFRVAASHGGLFREVVADHVVSTAFLMALTQEQLDLFIEVSLLADGCNARSGQEVLGQKRKAAAEQFQLACILSGRAATLHERTYKPGDRFGSHSEWLVNVSKRQFVRPVQAARQGTGNVERYIDECVVWCPVTPNQSWLARRDGTVYFTGNTLNKYRTEIGEPPVDGGDDPVLVDRQNLVLWSDMQAMSHAMVASKGAPAVAAGETPPGGEQMAGAGMPSLPSEAPEDGQQAPQEAIPAPTMARYRSRLAEALKAMPVLEAVPDAPADLVYRQLAKNFPPAAVAWVKDATWTGPKRVPVGQVDSDDRDSWNASREPAEVTRQQKKLRKKIGEGKHPKPLILVQRPGHGKLLIADGHHRFLAAEAEGQEFVWAFTGKVDAEHGDWDTMAASEDRGNAA